MKEIIVHDAVFMVEYDRKVETPCYSSTDVPKVRTTMTSLAQTEPSTDVRDGGGGSDVIPVYCALLGAVVAGLVIYVIVTQIRRGRARAVKSVAAPVPVCPQHVRESCVGQSNVHLATPGSDSGVAMDAEGKPGR